MWDDAGSAHVCLELNGCGLGFVVLGEITKEIGGSLFRLDLKRKTFRVDATWQVVTPGVGGEAHRKKKQ